VHNVEVDRDNHDVTVYLKRNKKAKLRCPTCGEVCPGYDSRERRWRHLDTCQYRTILVANVPRVQCDEHGILQTKVPWAEEKSRFTALFEALVIDWLHETSVSGVARLMNLSWEQVDRIMERAVERGLARRQQVLPEAIGVDETSFQKRHEYVTVVSNSDDGNVVHVADGKGADSLKSYYEQFSEDELDELHFVAMDMSRSYIAATKKHVPDAHEKIAFDKYHVIQALNDSVDKVRREENAALLKEGNKILTGTKYQWLQGPENMTWATRRSFASLRASKLKTARAWAIKETARQLWHYESKGWAERGWKRWYNWAIRSRLGPIKKAARTIKKGAAGLRSSIKGNKN
jgi:transposase